MSGYLPFYHSLLTSLGLLCLGVMAPTVSAGQAPPGHDPDQAAAQLLRQVLAEDPSPLPLDAPHPEWTAWQQYFQILDQPFETREDALHQLFERSSNPYIRRVIVRTIQTNPAYQSRRARFVKRYGFFANGFSRLVHASVQTLQGRLQSISQLFIDAGARLLGPERVMPIDRLIVHQTLQQTHRAHQPPPEWVLQLQKKIRRADARADLDRARWALQASHPETALVYAQQAVQTRPDWKTARQLEHRAASAVADQRRGRLASVQVGYPDRTPPVDLVESQRLREILSHQPIVPGRFRPEHRFLARLLADLPSPGQGRTLLMQQWRRRLRQLHAPDTPARRWATCATENPTWNPELRLDRATFYRRGRLLRYLFQGPEDHRQQIHKSITLINQAAGTLANAGLFYGVEFLGRAFKLAVNPPVPQREWLDAHADWLKHHPSPTSPTARKVADRLADEYLERRRFDDARRVLLSSDPYTSSTQTAIDTAEARHLLTLSEHLPPGPQRTFVLNRVVDLAPDSRLARRARQATPTPDPQEQEDVFTWRLDWARVARWIGPQPAPSLKAPPEWFDGQPDNGEHAGKGVDVLLDQLNHRLTLRFNVLQDHQMHIHQTIIDLDQLSERSQRWVALLDQLSRDAHATVRRFEHPPIPFQIEGGAGFSGVEVYPQLHPPGLPEQTLRLYR